MVPGTKISILDNQIGVAPPSTGDRLAVVGPCTLGPSNTPTLCWSATDVTTTFGVGPAVEAACYEIKHTGRPVLFVRTDTFDDGGYSDLDVDGVEGTSVITTNAGTEPVDDAECAVEFVTGGTVGTAGITYRTSSDDGRTWAAPVALGTANSITFGPNARINLAAGTIAALDRVTFRAFAPQWDTAQLTAAVTAVRSSLEKIQILEVVGPLDSVSFSALHAIAATFVEYGKEGITVIGHARMPDMGETEAAYKSAMDTEFSGSVSRQIVLCYGASEIRSAVDEKTLYRRPVSFPVASRVVNISIGTDPAFRGLGALPDTSIVDARKFPKHHDERQTPGADDSRFTTLRTWPDEGPAPFVNNCRLMSEIGSDFEFVQSLRLINRGSLIVRRVLDRRSSDGLLVDEKTGFIDEALAEDIDTAVEEALTKELLDTRQCSAVDFVLSRTDNILSTKRLRGRLRITPLAYLKQAEVDVSLFNPANNISTV